MMCNMDCGCIEITDVFNTVIVEARRQKAFSLATKLIDAVPLLGMKIFQTGERSPDYAHISLKSICSAIALG